MSKDVKDVKKGDIIFFRGDGVTIREEVVARLEDIVFTRELFRSGAVGPLDKPVLIEDLSNYGFEVEETGKEDK